MFLTVGWLALFALIMAGQGSASATDEHSSQPVAGEVADQHLTDQHLTDAEIAAEGTSGHPGKHEDIDSHELPNLITMIFGHKPDPKITDIQYWENVIFALFAGLILILIAQKAYRGRQMIPGRLQNIVEMCVEYFHDFFYEILGSHTKKYLPFLGTMFFYILTMNFMGMVPFLKAASSSINITASLALLTFFYAQYVGFKEMGPLGWLDHLAGSPRDAVGWAMVPLLLPIHVIGELAKPFSLAVRLFGNITGEDVLIFAFVMLGLSIMSDINVPVGLPLQALFIPLAILFSTIQALVFTVLSTIYIALMIPAPEGH